MNHGYVLPPHDVDEYFAEHRPELYEFAETPIGFDTQNSPGRTVQIVEWLESTLEETTLDVDRIEVDPEKPNLLATLAGETDRTL